MTNLIRATSMQEAQKAYIEAYMKRYAAHPVLGQLLEETRRAFAAAHVEETWPKLQRTSVESSKHWEYLVSPGLWSPEASGVLGGDLNLHCGEEATLATPGLIGISAIAIATDIGGTLLEVTPVSYRRSLAYGEEVRITVTFLEQQRCFSFFSMTGTVDGKNLFAEAEIKMMGVTIV